jgi:mono/diheme cytochrome c family protein
MHVKRAALIYLATAACVASGVLAPQPSPAQATSATKPDNSWDLSGGDAQRGQQLFANNGCGWCHEGGGRQAGRGPQLMNTTRTDVFIATRILNGQPGRMPAFGGAFDEDQIKDLVAFIHSIKPEATQ